MLNLEVATSREEKHVIKSEIPTRSKHGIKAYQGRREIQEQPRLDRAHNSRSDETGRKDRKSVLTDRKKEAADSAKRTEGYPSIHDQREKCPSRLSSRHTEKTHATKRTERDGNLVESKRDGPKRNKLLTREKVEKPHQDIEKGSVKSQVF